MQVSNLCRFAALFGGMLFAAGTLAGAAKEDREALQGSWNAESFERDGKPAPKEVTESVRVVVEGDQWQLIRRGEKSTFTMTALDPGRKPKSLDLTEEKDGKKVVIKCIFELDGDLLKMCRPFPGEGERPKAFRSEYGHMLVVMRRAKR